MADVGPAAAQERRQTWMITVMVGDVVDTIVFFVVVVSVMVRWCSALVCI